MGDRRAQHIGVQSSIGGMVVDKSAHPGDQGLVLLAPYRGAHSELEQRRIVHFGSAPTAASDGCCLPWMPERRGDDVRRASQRPDRPAKGNWPGFGGNLASFAKTDTPFGGFSCPARLSPSAEPQSR